MTVANNQFIHNKSFSRGDELPGSGARHTPWKIRRYDREMAPSGEEAVASNRLVSRTRFFAEDNLCKSSRVSRQIS
jgi:hypothetical protein